MNIKPESRADFERGWISDARGWILIVYQNFTFYTTFTQIKIVSNYN